MVLVISCNDESPPSMHLALVRTTEHKTEYTVMVDDNFHFMDEDERWTDGTYDRLDEALHKCMEMVGQFMLEQDYTKMKPDDLFQSYTSFGDDPFIIGPMRVKFSAWDYAEMLSSYLAGKPATEGPTAERQFRIANLGALILQARGDQAQ